MSYSVRHNNQNIKLELYIRTIKILILPRIYSQFS